MIRYFDSMGEEENARLCRNVAAASTTALMLTAVSIWAVVVVSAVGVYASGFWLLNRYFLDPTTFPTMLKIDE